ncbi:MAG: flagellar hook-length control protein FliK [Spirochaetaceae bacterium]|nr:flagellar hook-length control protein FliK [Spirochaetaceae bacterium]
MEALNIRLDQTESINSVQESVHGKNRNVQGESSFSAILEQVLEKSTDGIQNTEIKQTDSAETAEVQMPVMEESDSVIVESAENEVEVTEVAVQAAEVTDVAETAEEIPENTFADLNAVVRLMSEKEIPQVEEPVQIAAINEFAPEIVLNVEQAETVDFSEDLALTEKTGNKKKIAEDSYAESMFVFLEKDKNAVPENIALQAENTPAVNLKNKAKVSKNGEKNVIRVVDERTDVVAEKGEKSGFVSSVKFDSANSAEVSLSLSDSSTFENPVVPGSEKSSESVFASMLTQEFQSNSGELVKTGLITLKDNNTGSIKLILHPEQLGNVKIKLDLSEKIITGKIIVSSEEAFSAFKDSLESLRQAFINSGFENAGLELAFAGNGSSSEPDAQEQNKNPKGLVYSESLPVVAAGSDGSYVNYYDSTSINVVA